MREPAMNDSQPSLSTPAQAEGALEEDDDLVLQGPPIALGCGDKSAVNG